ncbi:hypothetical protein CLIB1423_01S04786 [[Candida] railenensis]|uniref:Uncharacterized protein n=1 Tax=[Candida] railenensis TaxID=45579 RepID=A0A9P0VVR3_9ASCO|nr:hypothetical protein CLIB1423_01S04786 [[Candida] railenensis]
MSYFLLPPVSYQTQQKLKNDMQKKKKKSSSKKRDALAPKKSDTQTIADDHRSMYTARSEQASSLKRPTFSQNSSYSNSSFLSTNSQDKDIALHTSSGTGRNSNETEITQYSDDVASLQFDNLSMTSKDSKLSIISKIKSVTSATTTTSANNSSYNYDYSRDINEILQYSKESRRKHHSKKATGTQSTQHEVSEVKEEEEGEAQGEEEEEQEEDVNYREDMKNGINVSDLPELERVYSDVSSIFSTKHSILSESHEQYPSDTRKKFSSKFKRS